jgi:hypothetical protein
MKWALALVAMPGAFMRWVLKIQAIQQLSKGFKNYKLSGCN